MNSSNLVDDTLQTILLFTLPNPLMVSSEEGGGTLICRYDGEGGMGVRFEDCKEIVRRHPPPSPTLTTTPSPTVITTNTTKYVYSLSTSPPSIYCLMLCSTPNFSTSKMQQIITLSHSGLSSGKIKGGYAAKPSELSSHLKSLFKPNANYKTQISNINEKLDDVKATMSDNIGVMLENSEKVEAIEGVSQELQQQSLVFRKKSTKLKRVLRCKNRKMTLIMVALVLLVIGIIVAIIVINAKTSGN
ncbi:hypothetical protein TrLO_g3265 [Triparma laevis f. longispina]|uniref:V-SNARE coiled-coil homology domain-containing protein n=1 Tax=Triparma laevis f. longispina TaxID=1714387 RepID=A0A9W7L0C3_9STRA|nr:hypothetical protein TrLO_g3265 [Triparma laevis f. longispina]